MAGRVLLKITYMLMRWTFGLAVLMFRGDQAKNAELLVLRPKTCPERPDQQVRASRLTSEIAQFTAQDPIFERHRFVVAGQGRVKS